MLFENARVWVFGEHSNGVLSAISYQLLGIASKLANKIKSKVIIVLIESNETINQECIGYGADYVINVSSYTNIECLIELVDKMHSIEEPDIVICGSTEWGINLAPRLAIKLCAGLSAHCVDLEICSETGRLLQTRPTSFNNLFATIISTSKIQMVTIKPNLFSPNNFNSYKKGQVIEYKASEFKNGFTLQKIIQCIEEKGTDNNQIVIGVGNGIVDYHAFKLVESFANLIHAPIYGSREAVAKGLVGFDRQIGITGKTINPKLYIAIGISGAHNHLLGISKTTKIVAVNTDIESEMVKAADYKIISDAKDFLKMVLQKIVI
jgi:electron transfer flavoprotein alpha subunit